jgi:hypothetical protein
MSTESPAVHTDAPEQDEGSPDTDQEREPATVASTPDGEPRGVAIYLTADDLRKLGILPAGVEAVVPEVSDGAVLIKPVQ